MEDRGGVMHIDTVWWIILGQSALLILLLIFCFRLSVRILTEKSRSQSQSTRYGQITEQFLPLVKHYPYDSKQFRFLGTPIDGVQFEDDKIVLVEFKSGNSSLSSRQRHIRNLVNENKVYFEIIRAG